MCENYSLTHICKPCQRNFLTPTQLYKRTLENGTDVYSFYRYSEIKELLHTKHTDLGYYIYKILAQNSLKIFAKEFHFTNKVVSLGVDEHIGANYSHTAILNKALKSNTITPLHAKLLAKNRVNYSGKTKTYRKQHPRDFVVGDFAQEDVIVVDDIVTTGTTLLEATKKLSSANKNVLFCLALCDVSKKN